MSATNDQLQQEIDDLKRRVEELERLLLTAPKGRARTSSVIADCEKAAKVELPLLLNTVVFIQVWQDFCKHRCDLATRGNINKKKFPWTERAAKAILKKCEAWGPKKAIEAMNTAMDKGWADIYEPEEREGTTPGKPRFEA